MLYSIIPREEIWAETEEFSILEMKVNGCMVEVATYDANNGVVLRILSTDPQDYLNPQYQPGTFIPLVNKT